MKVLITGALGQDGRIVTEILQQRGDQVIRVPDMTIGLNKESLLDPVTVTKLIQNEAPDKIIHLASVHGPSGSMNRDWTLDRKIYESGFLVLRNLMNSIKEVNPEIHLVAAASSRVFTPEKLIDIRNEDSQMNPSDFYGKVKARMRREIEKSRDSGLAFSTAILFNHYSTYSKGGYLGDVLAGKIHAAIREETLSISLNKPFARADLSHAKDICSSIVNILDLKDSGDFLLGSGVAKTMKELVDETGKLMNLEIKLNMDSIQEYEPCVVADVTKAKNFGVASYKSTYARAIVEKIASLAI